MNPVIVDIFIIILLIAASAVCIALLYGLKKIIQSVSMLQKDINELSTSLKPLIESTQLLTENINQITEETKSQLNVSKSIINDVRYRADKILDLENKVRDGMENAVMPFINSLSAIRKAFDAFWKRYNN
ncbi:MAG: hypothetical protein MUO34_07075 [Ignavibacteriaceae bacterium]|nr:hypothetical protein [Ignavibacteriaceae bacterium]